MTSLVGPQRISFHVVCLISRRCIQKSITRTSQSCFSLMSTRLNFKKCSVARKILIRSRSICKNKKQHFSARGLAFIWWLLKAQNYKLESALKYDSTRGSTVGAHSSRFKENGMGFNMSEDKKHNVVNCPYRSSDHGEHLCEYQRTKKDGSTQNRTHTS